MNSSLRMARSSIESIMGLTGLPAYARAPALLRWPMHQLSAAVGLGQPNRPPDVREVRAALNRSLAQLRVVAPAMVDGRFGPRTAGLIRRYNSAWLGSRLRA